MSEREKDHRRASPLDLLLNDFVESGEVSAAVGLVATGSERLWAGAAGFERIDSEIPATLDTVFDLASITKCFMATLALRLDAEGVLALSTRIADLWPAASVSLGRKRLEDLLRHRSGLPAWRPFYAFADDLDRAIESVLATSVETSPPAAYSDLGVFLWARSAERALDRPIDDLLDDFVLTPLRLNGRIGTAPGARSGIAECVADTGKEVELAAKDGLSIERLGSPSVGQPQDGNSRWLAMRGVRLPGHAGLFAAAEALLAFARAWLEPEEWLGEEAVSKAMPGEQKFGLGWWRSAPDGVSGPALSERAFGHPGFAGGNLWIDPGRSGGRIYVLLAHRTAPGSALGPWRRRFHELAAKAPATG